MRLAYSNQIAATASTDNGTIFFNSALGYADVHISSQQTENLELGNYVADLELIYIDGTKLSTPPINIQLLMDTTPPEGAEEESVGIYPVLSLVKKSRYA
jgi:hypothetical protein